ncbi:hypothetical protein CYY_005656 [Polysphondylium violaceum]|uniref:Uncharacterized protein n=1 Tax=Polysphondylium violaceum TaxID=133409 RepID=A0A8J4PTW6_9MYCE|nr:hypothetical protein CYY_005656 [Polysphondylium violaceum]
MIFSILSSLSPSKSVCSVASSSSSSGSFRNGLNMNAGGATTLNANVNANVANGGKLVDADIHTRGAVNSDIKAIVN